MPYLISALCACGVLLIFWGIYRDTCPRPVPPRPEGPRWVVVSRGHAFLARDKHGVYWTAYLPDAMAWKDRRRAEERASDLVYCEALDVSGYSLPPRATVD